MQTREMTALERDELLGKAALARRPRRPTARTQRLRTAMIALRRPQLPTSAMGRVTATLASIVIVAVVLALVLH